MEVSTKVSVDTIADVGSSGEAGVRAGKARLPVVVAGSMPRSVGSWRRATSPGFPCRLLARRNDVIRQPGVHLAASVSRTGWRGRWLGAGGCRAGRGTAALRGCRHERCSGVGTDGDRAGRRLAGDRRPGGGRFGACPGAFDSGAAIIPDPGGVRVWLTTGVTDMRRGMNTLPDTRVASLQALD